MRGTGSGQAWQKADMLALDSPGFDTIAAASHANVQVMGPLPVGECSEF